MDTHDVSDWLLDERLTAGDFCTIRMLFEEELIKRLDLVEGRRESGLQFLVNGGFHQDLFLEGPQHV